VGFFGQKGLRGLGDHDNENIAKILVTTVTFSLYQQH